VARQEITSADREPADPLFIQSVARAMDVLRCVGQSQRPITISEIAKETGLTQSNVWRLGYTLRTLGYLTISPNGEAQPGLPLLSLGYAALASDNVHTIVKPFLTELAGRFRAAAGLAVRNAQTMLYLERSDGNAMLTFNLKVGSAVPIISSAMGWAYLASLGREKRDALLAQVKRDDPARWKTNIKAFKAALAGYQHDGFILCIHAFHPAVGMAAVAVRHPQTGVPYTINCGGLTALITPDILRREVGPALLRAAGQIGPLLASVRDVPVADRQGAR
jgi:DNA-binding IclR family transcriptional regulator